MGSPPGSCAVSRGCAAVLIREVMSEVDLLYAVQGPSLRPFWALVATLTRLEATMVHYGPVEYILY
jgi:hypothetical protein